MTITVRMYNVGFGDSFLITVRRRTGVWRMLVDCGVHTQGVGAHKLTDIVADIIETVTGPDGVPRLDVVVASHRHRDHIAGFDSDLWQDVHVGEVWLSWVEDPDDPQAVALRERQQFAAQVLHHDLAAADQEWGDFTLNSVTNEGAMWTLREGFAGSPKRRYVSAGGARPRALRGLRGGSVYFLGPPRDTAGLSVMDPPKAERWLTVDNGLPALDGVSLFPAHAIGRVDYPVAYGHLATDPALLDALGTEPVDKLAAAFRLENAINNTSVFFLLQLGEALLLFPGDAQWGAWRPLLDDADIRELLSRTTVYKVSHHGSHNGTPTTFGRELLAPTVTSLLSVRPVRKFGEVPKQKLVDNLGGRRRRLIATTEPAAHPRTVERGPDDLWLEVTIPA
jgi:beta-lactamase superfamily II metal-dependent hydrolase